MRVTIFIDSANLPDHVAFNFGQFEAGFSINGSTPFTTGGAVFGNGVQLNFTGQWIDLGAATAFSRTVYWVDPLAPGVIDHILQWTITPSGASGLATISGFFESEEGSPLPGGLPASDVITEQFDGSHNPFNFSAAFLRGQVLVESPVPEPTTVGLLAAGLVGLTFARRRRAS